MDITTNHIARAKRKGESRAVLERARGAGEPVEDVWEDEIPEDVFLSVTGFKASEAAFWQVQELADSFESSYYDSWLDIVADQGHTGFTTTKGN
jgi:hypothetical protein